MTIRQATGVEQRFVRAAILASRGPSVSGIAVALIRVPIAVKACFGTGAIYRYWLR